MEMEMEGGRWRELIEKQEEGQKEKEQRDRITEKPKTK